MPFTTHSIIPTHPDKTDFNGDGLTDILWQNTSGTLVSWAMDATGQNGVVGAYVPDTANPKLHLGGAGDFSGDGTTDMVIQDLSGHVLAWYFKDNQPVSKGYLDVYGGLPPIQATGDFNGDGKTDMLWFRPPVQAPGQADGFWVSGAAENRKIPANDTGPMEPISIDFQLTGVGDFNGDGRDDILFRGSGNATVGTFLIEEPTGGGGPGFMPTKQVFFHDPLAGWNVLGIADFNGDGRSDLLWQHESGTRTMWFASGDTFVDGGLVPYPGADWSVQGVGDYNNDGKADLLWRSASTGTVAEWNMDGARPLGLGGVFATPGDEWHVLG